MGNAVTSVCTMLILLERRALTQLYMSTTPSLSAMSSMMSITMKQPVRPAPALNIIQHNAFKVFFFFFFREGLYTHFESKNEQTCVTVPAVHHDGPSRGRVGDFNPADEGEQSGGVVRNSVVGPASEVELLDLPHLVETTLRGEKDSLLHSTAFHLSAI